MHSGIPAGFRNTMKQGFQEEKDLIKPNDVYFQSDEKNRPLVLIGTINIMSIDLTLTRADKTVIFESQYKFSSEKQTAKRFLRIGQTMKVSMQKVACAGIKKCGDRKQDIAKN